jgi:hypothetical protein
VSRWRRFVDGLPMSEALPVDVLPASNGEFFPGDPTPQQRAVMALQEEEGERVRRRLGMTRRQFVRTAAAMGVGYWSINQVMGTRFGRFDAFGAPPGTGACDLEFPSAQLDNLPGEFIFDVQSHHIDSGGDWRVTNPGFHAVFAVLWEQSGPLGGFPGFRADGSVKGWGRGGELDPIENLSLFHYVKELYLDSSTTMTVLSAVPSDNKLNPLPVNKAAESITYINDVLAQSQRAVMHAFVMPNRGSAGNTDAATPLFQADEFAQMDQYVDDHGDKIRGWKVYTPWGDVPFASGWFLDDKVGDAFVAKVREVGDRTGSNKLIACHKGFALPAFDQRAASPRDIGVAAKRNPDVNFLVYHSGYDSEDQTAYPGDDNVNSADRGVDCFIKSLRENGYDASRFADGNVPNVYAEIGATMRSVMGDPDQLAHLLGKLLTHVGPRRVVYGTDSLWFGSPQSVIAGFRAFELSDEAKALYDLPWGLEGDRFDPQVKAATPDRSIRNGIFGRNAAEVYGIDPDVARGHIACDEVQKLRDAYVVNPLTPAAYTPGASNTMPAARSRRELIKQMAGQPWAP